MTGICWGARGPSKSSPYLLGSFWSKCMRKKYPLLVHGAIPTIKSHRKSSSSLVIKYHKDKVKIYRPALESNLSRKYSFSKSINDLGGFLNWQLAYNPENTLPSICRQFIIEAKKNQILFDWGPKFSMPEAKIVF